MIGAWLDAWQAQQSCKEGTPSWWTARAAQIEIWTRMPFSDREAAIATLKW